MCQGQNAVRHLRNEYNRLLETYSVLIMPTVPKVADKFPPNDATIKGKSIDIILIYNNAFKAFVYSIATWLPVTVISYIYMYIYI